jgi:hypothetical protein
MSAAERRIEIFDVCGGGRSAGIFVLVHIEDVPDDEGTYSALVARLDGDALTVEHRLPTWSSSIWCAPSGAIYVAGMDGRIHSNETGTWRASILSDRHTLSAVWGTSDGDVFCSGPAAQFYRKAGDGWIPFDTGLAGDLYAIGGIGRDDLYVLGEKGVLFHSDGGPWRAVESPTNVNLVDVHGVSRESAFVCGWKGKFFRLTQGRWEDFSLTDANCNLYRIAMFQDGIYVASANEGLLRFDGVQLVPFAPDVTSIGVRAVGDRLFAFGESSLQSFDGKAWRRIDVDLDAAVGPPAPGAPVS